MNALFLLFGAILGVYVGRWGNLTSGIISSVLALVVLFWAIHRKAVPWFLASFVLFTLIAGLWFHLPIAYGQTSVSGMVIRAKENYFIVQSGLARYYVSSKANGVEVGDFVRLEGKVVPFAFTHYESRFDFGAYLEDIGVRAEIRTNGIRMLFQTPIRLRVLEEHFLSRFNEDSKAILDSLLFGQKDYDHPFIAMAEEMNVLFMLSSSGLFFSSFLRIVEKGANRFFPKGAKAIAFASGCVFFPFAYAKAGVVRVMFMRLLALIDGEKNRLGLDYFSRLGLTGLFHLCFDFTLAYGQGYLLGYGIAVALQFSGNLYRFKSKIVTKLASLGILRAFLLPMTLSSSGEIHFLAPLWMLAVLPFAIPLLVLGWLGFFTFPIVPAIEGIVSGLGATLSFLSNIDPHIDVARLSLMGVAIFYVCFFLFLFFKEMGFTHLKWGILVGAIGLYAVSLVPVIPWMSASVSFIDVGQGDCALIQDGMTNVLIDTGGIKNIDLAKESLIPYFRNRRIYDIDCVIASHQDYDHVGALSSLMANYTVRRYVKDKDEFPLRIGNLLFENYNVYDMKDENDKSLVLSLEFMDKKWLFTGDAPSIIEHQIVLDNPTLDCDILKVGHHGSDTSTSEEFLDVVTPEVAIISCGVNNKYGHPKPIVLARLESRGIAIRRTDEEGTITYATFRF